MLSLKRYEEIKKNYGYISSWAIWEKKIDKEKSNMENTLFFFETNEACYMKKP